MRSLFSRHVVLQVRRDLGWIRYKLGSLAIIITITIYNIIMVQSFDDRKGEDLKNSGDPGAALVNKGISKFILDCFKELSMPTYVLPRNLDGYIKHAYLLVLQACNRH